MDGLNETEKVLLAALPHNPWTDVIQRGMFSNDIEHGCYACTAMRYERKHSADCPWAQADEIRKKYVKGG
jgi:hypothetical protein